MMNITPVILSWLKTVPGDSKVLPKASDNWKSWQASGLMTFDYLSGPSDIEDGLYRPVVAVNCFAVAPGGTPDYGKSEEMALAVYDLARRQAELGGVMLPVTKDGQRIGTVSIEPIPLGMPDDRPGNANGFAWWIVTIGFNYMEVS